MGSGGVGCDEPGGGERSRVTDNGSGKKHHPAVKSRIGIREEAMKSAAASKRKPKATCIRTGGSVEEMKQAILDNLVCVQGRFDPVATRNDYYLAVAYTVRDRLLAQWAKTAHTYYEKASRTVCYLSAEFLLGPHLENHLINLGLYEAVRQAVEELGLDFQALIDQEEEPGLGNGGLGRLAHGGDRGRRAAR